MAHSKDLAVVVVGGGRCVAQKRSEITEGSKATEPEWESSIIARIEGKSRKVAIHIGSFPTAVDALDAAVLSRIQAPIEIKPSEIEEGVSIEAVDLWDKEARLALYGLPEETKEGDFVIQKLAMEVEPLAVQGFWARVAAFFKKAFSFLVLWK